MTHPPNVKPFLSSAQPVRVDFLRDFLYSAAPAVSDDKAIFGNLFWRPCARPPSGGS
jgi:hypothetical protein